MSEPTSAWKFWNRRRPGADVGVLAQLASKLLSGKGEASGVALAARLLQDYMTLPEADRARFFETLRTGFDADAKALARALAAYQAAPGPDTATGLHAAAEPRRQELIRRMNLAPHGTLQLVRMREHLLATLKAQPALAPVDADFRHLFSSWFNRGFLELQRIDWSTPASVLERIIRYEAVHAIHSWEDLRSRLEPADRRCFGFFHPALHDEPLIFVEVALAREVPTAIAPLLQRDRSELDPKRASTAVFYSISNCQGGLKGVSFGNFLIKQVAENLQREVPTLTTYVTLSPLPGFARWLTASIARKRDWLAPADLAALAAIETAEWHVDASKALRDTLTRAAVRYLFEAKDDAGKPLDPVSRFHLGNGARLERLNWLGDVSPKGLRDGLGFMVNYLYDLPTVERNHEAYAGSGQVAASSAMRRSERSLARP